MAYTHLTGDERFYLEKRLACGDKVKDIAIVLGRHRSALHREINRNTDESFGFYSGLRANNIASDRNKATKRKVSFFENEDNKEALKILNEQLLVRSSPEQIASIICGDDSFDGYVSHTTIYKYIRADRLKGGKLHLHLRRRGVKYRTIAQKTEQAAIKNKQSIETRVNKEELYKEPGNWEIDTVWGKDQKSYLLTLVDIATSYSITRKIPNKESLTVYKEIQSILATTLLPFKTITSDNGTEFAAHEFISDEHKLNWYFCHAYCSNERGLNENTNGLIRDFYKKGTDFRNCSAEDLQTLQNILNNRPRKKLGFLTPTQKMVQMLQGVV